MKNADSDAVRSQYDFARGVRVKYLPRLAKGTNVVALDRDVAKIFPTFKAVNDALRVPPEAGKPAREEPEPRVPAAAKRSATRAPRVENACAMLAAGKRRICSFDRSGFYSKSLSSPMALEAG